MYEIYINDRPLRLVAQAPASSTDRLSSHLIAPYRGKIKSLLNYADMLEKSSPRVQAVTLFHPDLTRLWQDFLSHYDIVPAAGGLVRLADTDRYLFIYRLDRLDLPKGKFDQGETITQTALREICEETGLAVDSLQILPYWPGELRTSAGPRPTTAVATDSLSKVNARSPKDILQLDPTSLPAPLRLTLHTYRNKSGKRKLKPTWWLPLRSSQAPLQPQQEENIEWARWLDGHMLRPHLQKLYPSLHTIVKGIPSL